MAILGLAAATKMEGREGNMQEVAPTWRVMAEIQPTLEKVGIRMIKDPAVVLREGAEGRVVVVMELGKILQVVEAGGVITPAAIVVSAVHIMAKPMTA